MDSNGNLNMNWGFLDPPLKRNLGFQLMTSITEKPPFRDHHHSQPAPLMSSTIGGPYHHNRVNGISDPHAPMDYWLQQNRDRFMSLMPVNRQHAYYQSSYGVSPEPSSAHSAPMPPHPVTVLKSENVMSEMEEMCEEMEDARAGSSGAVVKKRRVGKAPESTPKEKKPRTRTPRAPKDEPTPSSTRARPPKKRAEIVINGINMDISEIPTPVCSCTGTPQQCYRWGSGGWQSACCTTGLSVYPLPMSTKRRGARIAGRKMSIGAFKKVLEKLTSEGYNFSGAIDLRNHWAKHGTNKFVTIR